VADLIAISPCDGVLPLTIGDVRVTEELPGALTSLAAFKGREKELAAALKTAHEIGRASCRERV